MYSINPKRTSSTVTVHLWKPLLSTRKQISLSILPAKENRLRTFKWTSTEIFKRKIHLLSNLK